jgi:hypothetical protein
MKLNEDITDDFYDLLEKIVAGKKKPAALSEFMESFEVACAKAGQDSSNVFSEYFDIVCEGVSEIVNDADFRSDELGENATTNPEILTLLFESVMKYDENVGVVLATNTHTPLEILEKLAEWDYSWEEDSVTNALARNTDKVEILRKLATHEEGSTRFSVAENKLTPSDVLEALADSNDCSDHLINMNRYGDHDFTFFQSMVKYAVLTNPMTPMSTIDKFLDGTNHFEQEGVLQYSSDEEINDLNAQLLKLAATEKSRPHP